MIKVKRTNWVIATDDKWFEKIARKHKVSKSEIMRQAMVQFKKLYKGHLPEKIIIFTRNFKGQQKQ